MNGTSWIQRISHGFAETRATWKAAPNPASLYPPPQQSYSSGPIVFPGYEQWQQQYGNGGNNQNAKDQERAKTALTSSWVFADINAVANEASVSMLEVMERSAGKEEDREVVNHPLEVLWEAPNPFMGRSYLMKFWIFNLLLSGKAALFWVPGGDGIAECWPLPSWMLTPIPHPTKFIDGYEFRPTPTTKPIRIENKYVTYSRLVHPFDLRDGLSPLAAIFDAIEADLAMRRWNKQFFAKENAAPTGLILVPKDMLDPDLARVRMEIMEFFGGANNRRVGVARAGDMDWKPFDRSQKDMEFLEGRRFSREEIDRAFGFPEGYWSDKASRANAEGAAARMIENAVWPHLVMLAEDLNAQTIPVWYGKQYRAQFSDIRPRNRQLELQELSAAQATLTVDEIRKKYWKMEPIGDERGKLLIAEVGKGGGMEEEPPTDPSSLPPATLPEDGSNPTDADQLAPDPDALDAPDEAKALDLARWQAKAVNALKRGKRASVAFVSDAIPADEYAAIKILLDEATTIEAVRDAFKKKENLTPDEMRLMVELGRVFARHADAIEASVAAGNTPNLAALEADLETVLRRAIVDHYTQRALAIAGEMNVTFDATQVRTDATTWANQYTPELISGLTDTTREMVQQVITEVRTTPLTLAQAAERLAPAFGRARAEMIATTELTRARAQATVASQNYLRANGINTVMIWRTNADEITCAICVPRNGARQGEGWDEPPPAHPRCRCAVTLTRV